jgi:hypothetical protein
MSTENESFLKKLPEITQRFNLVTSLAALGAASIGIIPIGITLTFIEFNAATYIGAEIIKGKKD